MTKCTSPLTSCHIFLCCTMAHNICTALNTFTMKQLQKLTHDIFGKNKSFGRYRLHCGSYEFARFFEGRNIMPNVIYYQRYSLEAMKRAIKQIIRPDNTMTLSWGTVNFKLDKMDFLNLFIMDHKHQSHIVKSYVKESKKLSTEERVRF